MLPVRWWRVGSILNEDAFASSPLFLSVCFFIYGRSYAGSEFSRWGGDIKVNHVYFVLVLAVVCWVTILHLSHDYTTRPEEGRSIQSSSQFPSSSFNSFPSSSSSSSSPSFSSSSFQQFPSTFSSFGQTPRFSSRPTPVQTAPGPSLPAERPSPPQTVFRDQLYTPAGTRTWVLRGI